MTRLGVNHETLNKVFWELKDDDLWTSTAIMEPNARGQQKKELSWIWQMTGMNITNQTTVVNECQFQPPMANPGPLIVLFSSI